MLRHILQPFFFISTLSSVGATPIEPRLALTEEWNGYYHTNKNGPGSYTFGYDLEDTKSGNVQYRVEEKYTNGTVKGSYGLLEPDGNIKVVKYIADEYGYRAVVDDTHQKYPRYHPPLSSRTEKERNSDYIRTPSYLSTYTHFGQSIQEIRTPPKYHNTWRNNIINFNI